MNQTEDVYYTQMKRNTGSAECIKFKGTLEGGGEWGQVVALSKRELKQNVPYKVDKSSLPSDLCLDPTRKLCSALVLLKTK